MRFNRIFLGIVCSSSLFGLCGCFSWYDYNSASNYGSQRDEHRQDTSRAYQTAQQYTTVSHNHTRLEMNQFLSDQVAAMNGVNSAIVMMADNTAYVAIIIDSTASGTKSSTRETNNGGTVRGLYNPATPFNDYADPNKLATGTNSYETVQHHEQISHLFKQKIAEKIRSLQPTVVDVYISAHRDYINELNRLAQESWKGNDLTPYVKEFDAISDYIFGTQPTIPTQSEG
ncbi:YhcN/YlaJ family sporulation lipoprotein [Paenibacillus radicis (ex Xue et al. 2023)]|uniref:YhcN/YlaJ family sporulation lipoprotein n=1 Tax=Paenibacillus radicis (ex Xue et al. 2023) TaxID=2972489 RepID=A0ABT1YN82_9BACL|nr:YhcN/YlaJ family sporulation lipoprotein [Paenibacillus radicis (ex Xue et al. 2023)]MCR8633854.1 YhcN/YlaJ family sporulation lipoprotein [Paenibacillus radicis (ex Xue et al. 2023)]